jgi:hypothetical protein
MAEANRSLSPKLALERTRRHRYAVFVLAMQRAKKSVLAQLRAQGLKPQHFSARGINLMAKAELERNRARLVADAEEIVATSALFARWRLPVVVKSCANYNKPNTATTPAQQSLQTKGVSNGE